MNQINKLLLAIALVVITLVAGGGAEHFRLSAQPKNTEQFTVGVLRADGKLVPFAEYRHGLWWNPWPEPAPQAETREVTPKSLGNHPEPWFERCGKTHLTWYYYGPSADSPLVLKAAEKVRVENHSQTNWALTTDYSPKQVPEKVYCHGHVGMALNVALKVESMIEIGSGDDEAKNIVAFVKPIFSSAETAEVARIVAAPAENEFLAASGFPLSNEQRAKVGLTLTKLFRSKSGGDGAQLYYIEAEKQYKKPASARDSSCDNVSFLGGWVTKGKDGTLALLNESFGLTNCDGKEKGSSVESFSVMTLNDRTFVFAVEHGWEDESYTIYELKDSGLDRLLVTFGG